jgi:fatty acid desaturase
MTDKISIILRYSLFALMLAAIVVFAMFFFGGHVSPANYDIQIQGLDEETQIPVFTGLAINLAAVYFIICAAAAILFPIVFFNIKKAKNTLIGLGVMILLIVISYALAGTEPVNIIGYEGEMSESMLKNVGTGINLMFALIGLAVVVWIYAEVSKIFK